MNINKLKVLESKFFAIYPGGFENEELEKISKKHNFTKISNYVKEVCSKDSLSKGVKAIDDIMKVVSKSSMVSVFEKMRFRDLVKEFDLTEKELVVGAVYDLLHGDEEEGFTELYNLLSPYKLAKWPILTVFRAYYYSDTDLLIKPTTVKKIIKYLEITDIEYSPKASYEFYNKYRGYINMLKEKVDSRLSPSNAAFSGFMMISID